MTTSVGRDGTMYRLAGKTALVTGASGGIGTAVAHRLSAAGVRLVVCGRDRDRVEHLASETEAVPFVGDLTDPETCQSAVATVEQRFGRLDLVHLGVGTRSECRDVAELDLADYRKVMATNVDSIVFSLAACVPALRRAGGGSVTVLSSLGSVTAYGRFPIYILTKAGLNGLVRAAGRRLARNNIHLAALCTSFVDVPLLGDLREHLVRKEVPLLPAAEVADAVMQLLRGKPGDEPIWTLQPGRPLAPYAYPDMPSLIPASEQPV